MQKMRTQKWSTAKLPIWMLRIWGFAGPGFQLTRQVLCGDASRLFLDHFSKHLSSILGWTELWNPGPQKPKSSQRKPLWRCPSYSVRFRVRFQAVKVQIVGGFPVESPTKKANRLKALLRGISLSEYVSHWFRVRLRGLSECGSVAYLVERPTRETQAEECSDTILTTIPKGPWHAKKNTRSEFTICSEFATRGDSLLKM